MTPEDLETMTKDPPIKVDDAILDHVQGSMVGMALGDALGAHVEFRPRQYLIENPVLDLTGGGTWGLEKGQFTDDTSMALCLASSLVTYRDFIPYDQLVRYKWWYKYGYMSSTGQCFDIGEATRHSLCEFERRQRHFADMHQIRLEHLDHIPDPHILDQFDVFCSEDGVAGNGALMRLAPVPLFFHRYPVQAVRFSGVSGVITHGDRKAYDACRYYGALIVAALHKETKQELLDDQFYSKHESWFSNEPLVPEVMKIALGSYKKMGGYKAGIRGNGYIINALEAALWALWSNKDSFEIGAINAVNLGDDTDTTAAIYGQLAGALYGFKSLPEKWVKYLYGRSFIECLSKWITYEGQMWQAESPKSNIPSPSSQLSPGVVKTTPITSKPTAERKLASAPSSQKPSANKPPIKEREHPTERTDARKLPVRTTRAGPRPNEAASARKPSRNSTNSQLEQAYPDGSSSHHNSENDSQSISANSNSNRLAKPRANPK